MFRVVVLIILGFLCISLFGVKSNKVLLKNIESLTLNAKSFVTSRKGYHMPQMKCIGGTAFNYPEYHPQVSQCYNRGSDGYDIQWECKSELDNSVEFGSFELNCEGYDYPDDKYILHGSCSLRYNLNFRKRTHKVGNQNNYLLPIIILIIVALVIWYYCLLPGTSSGSDYSTYPEEPRDPPPDYYHATHGNFFRRPPNDDDDHHSRRRPNTSSRRSHYGWNTNIMDDDDGYGNKGGSQFSSMLSNGLSAGAGFLGGYFMGSRSANNCSSSSRRFNANDRFDSYASSTPDYDTNGSQASSSSTRMTSGFGGTSRR